MYGVGPNNQGVVQRKDHYIGHKGVAVAHGPKHIKPLKPKPASPIKGRDIPTPQNKILMAKYGKPCTAKVKAKTMKPKKPKK